MYDRRCIRRSGINENLTEYVTHTHTHTRWSRYRQDARDKLVDTFIDVQMKDEEKWKRNGREKREKVE